MHGRRRARRRARSRDDTPRRHRRSPRALHPQRRRRDDDYTHLRHAADSSRAAALPHVKGSVHGSAVCVSLRVNRRSPSPSPSPCHNDTQIPTLKRCARSSNDDTHTARRASHNRCRTVAQPGVGLLLAHKSVLRLRLAEMFRAASQRYAAPAPTLPSRPTLQGLPSGSLMCQLLAAMPSSHVPAVQTRCCRCVAHGHCGLCAALRARRCN